MGNLRDIDAAIAGATKGIVAAVRDYCGYLRNISDCPPDDSLDHRLPIIAASHRRECEAAQQSAEGDPMSAEPVGRLASHPLVMEQGGTSVGDRACRVISKLEARVKKLETPTGFWNENNLECSYPTIGEAVENEEPGEAIKVKSFRELKTYHVTIGREYGYEVTEKAGKVVEVDEYRQKREAMTAEQINGMAKHITDLQERLRGQDESISEQANRIAELEAQRVTLRTALGPFVEQAEKIAKDPIVMWVEVPKRDLYAAAAAMEATSGDFTSELIAMSREADREILKSDIDKIAKAVEYQEGQDLIDVVRAVKAKADECNNLLALCEQINHALWPDPDASHDTEEAPEEIDKLRTELERANEWDAKVTRNLDKILGHNKPRPRNEGHTMDRVVVIEVRFRNMKAKLTAADVLLSRIRTASQCTDTRLVEHVREMREELDTAKVLCQENLQTAARDKKIVSMMNRIGELEAELDDTRGRLHKKCGENRRLQTELEASQLALAAASKWCREASGCPEAPYLLIDHLREMRTELDARKQAEPVEHRLLDRIKTSLSTFDRSVTDLRFIGNCLHFVDLQAKGLYSITVHSVEEPPVMEEIPEDEPPWDDRKRKTEAPGEEIHDKPIIVGGDACEVCGFKGGHYPECPEVGGTGPENEEPSPLEAAEIEELVEEPAKFTRQITCPTCDGDCKHRPIAGGAVTTNIPCSDCGGTGKVDKPEEEPAKLEWKIVHDEDGFFWKSKRPGCTVWQWEIWQVLINGEIVYQTAKGNHPTIEEAKAAVHKRLVAEAKDSSTAGALRDRHQDASPEIAEALGAAVEAFADEPNAEKGDTDA